ncbi:MAG: prepilin-type N-terminal cleavage/methylation domain-containing protein [Candidatus Omnitrophota bacterium]
MRNILKKNTAFTLVELLVVVVIIGVLVSIAIPHYMNVRERTENQKARAILYEIYKAEKMYLLHGDNDGNGIPDSEEDTDLDGFTEESYTATLTDLQDFVDFPADDGTWDYTMNSADATTFEAQATHQIDGTRFFTINESGTIN